MKQDILYWRMPRDFVAPRTGVPTVRRFRILPTLAGFSSAASVTILPHRVGHHVHLRRTGLGPRAVDEAQKPALPRPLLPRTSLRQS